VESVHDRPSAQQLGHPRDRGATSFHGVLFDGPRPSGRPDRTDRSPSFRDLNLDQILAAMSVGREAYDIAEIFLRPLRDAETVRYRHEVFRDLASRRLVDGLSTFSRTMRTVRRYLRLSGELRYRYQRQAWFLDAASLYQEAVHRMIEDLEAARPRSRALIGLLGHLHDYVGTSDYGSFARDTVAVRDGLAGIRYCVRIDGSRVTVSRYRDDADYTTEVESTFERFRQGAVRDYRADFRPSSDVDHVEARILDLVARLFAAEFGDLDRYCDRYSAFVDGVLDAFDLEIQFYLAYLAFIGPMESAGLTFCYPRVSADTREVHAEGAFDLALADKLIREGRAVVPNDFSLHPPERVLVVTGPNQGGKTTFARTFGQSHYLASLGCPVPGRAAQMLLPDALYTHFEREEESARLTGKLEDELIRAREILRSATDASIVIMNESLTATTLADALAVGRQVLRQLIDLGALCVWVTFVDELASLDRATVSMVSMVSPDDPALRTYKVVRRPADGRAYAVAIARKHGLTYDAIRKRIGR
jgi:DNA mismatch repair protein MutS